MAVHLCTATLNTLGALFVAIRDALQRWAASDCVLNSAHSTVNIYYFATFFGWIRFSVEALPFELAIAQQKDHYNKEK